MLDQEKEEVQLQQYKGMFNSLQEGILVYYLPPAEELEPSAFQLFFANSLVKAIFGHVSPNKDKVIDIENKVVYQY